MSKITNVGFNPVWHRMLYSCTHMATVGFKGLTYLLTYLLTFLRAFDWHAPRVVH